VAFGKELTKTAPGNVRIKFVMYWAGFFLFCEAGSKALKILGLRIVAKKVIASLRSNPLIGKIKIINYGTFF